MSEFEAYFYIGKDHILDYREGYDHILFVIALSAMYLLRDWKHVLVLVTAFTVGHSITLALATLQIISVDFKLTELLIPITIFITAGSNIFRDEESVSGSGLIQINYFYALFFGLIHGLGFSNNLRGLLGSKNTDHFWVKLLGFNVGLEVGQIIIVVVFLIVSFIVVDLFSAARRDWKIIISSAVAGASLVLINERFYWPI